MLEYYVHYRVANMGAGNVILEAEIPLCAQDLKALKKRILDQTDLPPGTPPEVVDIDFIFPLRSVTDVQTQR